MKNVVYPRVIEKFGVVQVDFEKEGDFGYLTRFDLYSNKKTATIELWSSRWVGLEIYKLENRDIDIIYNKMISPDEVSEKISLNLWRFYLMVISESLIL